MIKITKKQSKFKALSFKLKQLLPIIILIVCTACIENKNYDATKYDIIIQNIKLFDGEEIFDNATLLTKDGTIINIITDGQTAFHGDNVIEGHGRTLVPGMINAHVHAFSMDQSKEAVQSGVLTLLDLFSNYKVMSDSLRLMGNTSKSFAYYYTAGATVTVPDGHATQFGPVPTVTKEEEISSFIEERVKDGSDFIKLIIERGGKTKIPTLSNEMIRLAIEKSNALEKVSLAHVSWRSDAITAAEYGITGLAHIWRRDSIGISDKEIELFKEKNIFVIPTLLVRKTSADKNTDYGDMDLVMNDNLKLYNAGIPLLAGTDAPNNGLNYGSDLISEMELLVKSGVSDFDALKAGTSNPAKFFKLTEKGHIKQGWSADFLLIDGDPTKDVSEMRNLVGVWKHGERVKLHGKE